MKRYYIVRFYKNHNRRKLVKKGLTLKQAREHCQDPETSSSTCKGAVGRSRTKRLGPWFDGYHEES